MDWWKFSFRILLKKDDLDKRNKKKIEEGESSKRDKENSSNRVNKTNYNPELKVLLSDGKCFGDKHWDQNPKLVSERLFKHLFNIAVYTTHSLWHHAEVGTQGRKQVFPDYGILRLTNATYLSVVSVNKKIYSCQTKKEKKKDWLAYYIFDAVTYVQNCQGSQYKNSDVFYLLSILFRTKATIAKNML